VQRRGRENVMAGQTGGWLC